MVDRPKFKSTDEVDSVIIGSVAGGIFAEELSTLGFRVVVGKGPTSRKRISLTTRLKFLRRIN